MQFKKSFVPAIAILVVGGSLLGTSTLVYAESQNPQLTGLAQALASKFHLNQSDVQTEISSYIQQHKDDLQQKMADRQKARLDTLVSQGKITTAQETAILNEYKTLQTQYGPAALTGKTFAQKIQAKKDERNALTTWANSQGIDPQYVLPFEGLRKRGAGNQLTPTP